MLNNTDKHLIEGILNFGPEAIENAFCDPVSENIQKYIDRCLEEKLNYPMPMLEIPTSRQWFIPNEYQHMDIEEFLVNQCPEENYERLIEEINLFKKHDMVDVLKAMKYIVDTLRENNIVWGVGRGSSVSSYCLYLIGIHKIDSIKYNLPITEFFKGENDAESS